LVTVIGNAGFWGRHLYLVGGLAPRYFVSTENPCAPAHVGTQDIDLAVVLALDIASAGEYEKVAVRITGLLPFLVLKTMAFVERHGGKDAYWCTSLGTRRS
jgi:hypothetical protein